MAEGGLYAVRKGVGKGRFFARKGAEHARIKFKGQWVSPLFTKNPHYKFAIGAAFPAWCVVARRVLCYTLWHGKEMAALGGHSIGRARIDNIHMAKPYAERFRVGAYCGRNNGGAVCGAYGCAVRAALCGAEGRLFKPRRTAWGKEPEAQQKAPVGRDSAVCADDAHCGAADRISALPLWQGVSRRNVEHACKRMGAQRFAKLSWHSGAVVCYGRRPAVPYCVLPVLSVRHMAV